MFFPGFRSLKFLPSSYPRLQMFPSGQQPFLRGVWKAHLARASKHCPVPSVAACTVSFILPVRSGVLTPRVLPPHTARVLGHWDWALYSSLFSHPLPCSLPIVEAKDTHKQEEFHFYSYPHMSTDPCYVESLRLWATPALSVEDFT